MNILLAGATGQVGRRLLPLLTARGHEVKPLPGRQLDLTQPGAARGLAAGADLVISCAGASVSLGSPDKRPYTQVDTTINIALLEEAVAQRVPRFLYLSVHVEPVYSQTAYVQAHERFVQRLQAAPLTSTVLRPTGIFSAFADLLPMAQRGITPLIGDGRARTNPIAPDDVAELLAGQLHEGPADLPCGGPEVLTRRQINEALLSACGKNGGWMPAMPAAVVRLEAKLVRPFHPRLAELMEFFSYVATSDCIAPALGKRSLADYLGTAPV